MGCTRPLIYDLPEAAYTSRNSINTNEVCLRQQLRNQEDMDPDSNPALDYLASFGFTLERPDKMDDDDFSGLETPQEVDSPSAVQGQMEKQLESLKGYLDALPYECETPEEMQTKLEFIIGKMDVCVRSKNWSLLPNWSQLLHWCVAYYRNALSAKPLTVGCH